MPLLIHLQVYQCPVCLCGIFGKDLFPWWGSWTGRKLSKSNYIYSFKRDVTHLFGTYNYRGNSRNYYHDGITILDIDHLGVNNNNDSASILFYDTI